MISKSSISGRRRKSAAMHILSALALTLALCGGASGQTTHYVDDDNCPGPGSGGAFDPYCAIQDAIVASADGDTVEVAPGTYFEAIDFIGKAITLRSRDGAATTIIDATNVPIAFVPDVGSGVTVVLCVKGETAATVLDGFTITGGIGLNAGSWYGGGMYILDSYPTVTNCVFTRNVADYGGGIFVANFLDPMGSSITVSNCTFSENVGGGMYNYGGTVTSCIFSDNSGGGMYNSRGTVTNCTFTGNTGVGISNGGGTVTGCNISGNSGIGISNAGANSTVSDCTINDNTGTGMYIGGNGSPMVTNCTFDSNTGGGGMKIEHPSRPTVSHCIFNNNTAASGGGINIQGQFITISDCIFNGNTASFDGGGVNIQFNSTDITVNNCTFKRNTADRNGGGMLVYASGVALNNCTFSENDATGEEGGGMYIKDSNSTITNCSFVGNTARGSGGGLKNTNSNMVATNCTFNGNMARIFGGGMKIFNSNRLSFYNQTLTNCAFTGNNAHSGGGLYNDFSSPTIFNSTFSANTTKYAGCGLFNDESNPTLTNCNISNNTSMFSRGGIRNINTSTPTFTNCILWGNSPDEIYNGAASMPIYIHSDIDKSGGSTSWDTLLGIDGGGNIDADPLFVDPIGLDGVAGTADDDLRLQGTSPCIDAGDYDAYLAAGGGLVDLDGKDRAIDNMSVADTGVGSVTYLDMGAYEQGPCHGDGIINLNDLESLAGCLVGPDGGVNPSCGCSDYEPDGQVDLRDYASYQLEFTGPPTPTAEYQLTFESAWSAATHPQDFPSGPHFSGLIGGTHNRNVKFWEVGQLSSVGIEDMAELGSKTPLTSEVNAAISAGNAESVISGNGISPSPGSVSVNFTATQAFGLVTITSMLAPSPDWFVGLDSVALFNHNRWADEIVVAIEPFDAGTDSGVSYASADADTNPAEAIAQIVGYPFLNGADQAPLGSFTITRID